MESKQFSAQIRRIILERSYAAHVGHIGSGLSVAEIMALLYSNVLRIQSPNDLDRDRFILSKGHAALALYAALYLRGWITEEELNSFGTDATLLGVHPEHKVTGVDFCTGSLGQGLTYGAGCALAARIQKSSRRTFVLVSDAECNEGSIWEAAMFAAQRKLSNLIIILDLNGQQALGYTSDIMDLSPMSAYWKTFGWDVHEADGHDIPAMEKAILNMGGSSSKPHILIAHTIFGKGVSFMENQIKWHYLPLTEDDYRRACNEIKNTP
jgi:transketolase